MTSSTSGGDGARRRAAQSGAQRGGSGGVDAAIALQFYNQRLRANPAVARFHHLAGALQSARGQAAEAEAHFRAAVALAPHNLHVHNDLGLHLAQRHGAADEGIKELRRATLIHNDSNLLHRNLGALYGRIGDYPRALEHCLRARLQDPNDAMNLRNMAKIHSLLGDTHSALQENLTAIHLDDQHHSSMPNTSAYRAAAVQIISQGGDRDQAVQLMRQARQLEKKSVTLPTSQRTEEIIEQVRRRQRVQLLEAEKRKAEEERQRIAAEEEWRQLIPNLQPQTRKLS